MQRKLNVLVVEPNKLPYEKIIPNTLKAKQELVGGLIQYSSLETDDDIYLVSNEESKCLNMEINRTIGYDIIVGPFFIVGNLPDFGEDRSLTDEQIKKYKQYFGKDSILETENHLLALSIKKQKNYEL